MLLPGSLCFVKVGALTSIPKNNFRKYYDVQQQKSRPK